MNGKNTTTNTTRLGAVLTILGMLCILKPSDAQAYVAYQRARVLPSGVTQTQRIYYNPWTGKYHTASRFTK